MYVKTRPSISYLGINLTGSISYRKRELSVVTMAGQRAGVGRMAGWQANRQASATFVFFASVLLMFRYLETAGGGVVVVVVDRGESRRRRRLFTAGVDLKNV